MSLFRLAHRPVLAAASVGLVVCSWSCDTGDLSGRRLGAGAAGATGFADTTTVAVVGIAGGPIGEVTRALRLPSGLFAITDASLGAVHLLDRSGTFLRTVGRRGSGPGEFQSVAWADTCGQDSVFVWDAISQRVTVLDATGNVVRDFRLSKRPAIMVCSPGVFGVMEMPATLTAPSGSGPPRVYEANLLMLNAAGDSTGMLGTFPLGDARPLGTVTRVAMRDGEFLVATGDSAWIQVVSPGRGRPATGFAVPVTRRRSTRQHYEAAIERAGSALNEEGKRQFRSMMLEVPMPEDLPLFGKLLGDKRGVWVVTSAPGDTTVVVVRIDVDGSATKYELPPTFEVMDGGADYLLGRQEAADGGQVLTLYRP